MLERYIRWVIAQRKWLTVITFLAVAIITFGASKLTFTSDFRTYFGPDNPQLLAFENMERTFSKQENVFFYVRAKEGDIFTNRGLALIETLTNKGWELPHSQRVTSLQNYQHTDVEEDELMIDYLYEEAMDLDSSQLQRIKNITFDEPTMIHRLISEDGASTGVTVRTVLPEEMTREASGEVVNAARDLANTLRPEYPDFDIMIGGSLASNVTMGEAIKQDIENLLGLSYLIMIIAMVILLRTFSGMILTLMIISFSVLSTIGLFGWLGFTMTPPTGFVPTAILTIAVADTIHILITYYYELTHGRSKLEAIQEALRINFSPVFITSITTIIGVLCLNTSDSPPYQDMGNMIAAGVFFAWIYSITFLPAMLAIMPAPKGKAVNNEPTGMIAFADFVIKHYKPLFVAMLVLILAVGVQVNRNIITERWHEFFDETFEVRNTLEATNDSLGGLHRIFFVLDSKEEGGINSPAFLQQADDFSKWLATQNKVTSVDSLTDIIKRLNKNLHENDQDWYQIPESRELSAQYLLLYELSLPLGLGLDDTINNARSAIRMSVAFSKADSIYILELEQKALEWLDANAPAIHVNEGTGLDIVFANLTFRNIGSMMSGTSMALVLISFLLIFALRSFKIGMISLVPNIVPAVLAYGIWGMINGQIDTAISVVVCLSLGIVVDDTVHFLSKYLRARREKGYSAEEAIRYAFSAVGTALIVTSTVLIGGFMVMQFSHFNPSNHMGMLLAITILVALLVDFLFLPPLLMFLDRNNETSQNNNEPEFEIKAFAAAGEEPAKKQAEV
ncbi:efflux RND transporter permease subunit [Bacterioplanoides sp.]|uniref:efflux RND transporter permease subunit n=1 Tax=Bacterioplanoides sp. TaxID=2066072 RepID=UPI003B5A01A0